MVTEFQRQTLQLVTLWGETFYVAPFVWDEKKSQPVVTQSRCHWICWLIHIFWSLLCAIFVVFQFYSKFWSAKVNPYEVIFWGNFVILSWITYSFILWICWNRHDFVRGIGHYVKLAAHFEDKFGPEAMREVDSDRGKLVTVGIAIIALCLILLYFLAALLFPEFPFFLSSLFPNVSQVPTIIMIRIGFAVMSACQALMIAVHCGILGFAFLPWADTVLRAIKILRTDKGVTFGEFAVMYGAIQISVGVINDLTYIILPFWNLYMMQEAVSAIYVCVRCPQAVLKVFYCSMAFNAGFCHHVALTCMSYLQEGSTALLRVRGNLIQSKVQRKQLKAMRKLTISVGSMYTVDRSCAKHAIHSILENSVNLLVTF